MQAIYVYLVPMTRELCRAYWQGFVPDPAIYMDMSLFKPFIYDEASADAYFDRQLAKHRILLAIQCDGAVVGEMVLSN